MINRAHSIINRISKLSLTQKFVLGSLAAIVVTGIITGLVLTNKVREQFIDGFAYRAAIARRMAIAHDLQASDFEPGNTRLGEPEFDRMMKRMVLAADSDIKIVKIWRTDGTVLYSNVRTSIGERSPEDVSLKKAFSGELVFKEERGHESHARREVKRLGNLTAVYAPISFDDEIVGALEPPHSTISERSARRMESS